jgi:hypothetical protein
MAIKTFTTGEVLTAADTNTYLANSGLVFVKSQAIGGTSVSSVQVTNAFSADYDNYRILLTGGSSNTPLALEMQMGTSLSGSGYYVGTIGTNYTGGTSSGNVSNGSTWTVAGSAMPDGLLLDVVVTEPFLSRKTGLAIYSRIDYRTNGAGTMGNGYHNSATSYTGFSLIVSGGTISGGTILIYGFRKA